MIWRLENHEGEKVWYSEDLILKIKELCKQHISGKKIVMAQEIIDLIENEAKDG